MANGRELILTTLNPGSSTGFALSWIDLASGNPPRQLVALGGNAATPAVSRNGSVAYSTIGREGTLWRQDIPAKGEPALPPEKINSVTTIQLSAEYSPDGSHVAFSSERSATREIWTCASDGSHCQQVTSMNRGDVRDLPRWSPDSRQIVFGSNDGSISDVYIVDANGGAPRRLTTEGPHGTCPYWSHDGNWIYYSSFDTGKHGIWKIAASGGKATQITRDRGKVVIDSTDSKSLYFCEGAKLFRTGANGDGETELVKDISWASFAVARDRIYYIHEDAEGVNEIRQFLLANGENSRVVRIDKPLTTGLTLSPDGRALLYAEFRRRGNLMIAENLY
jgi:WD40 repeat protein